MNTRVTILTCALFATGCGGADAPAARSPSSTDTTSASSTPADLARDHNNDTSTPATNYDATPTSAPSTAKRAEVVNGAAPATNPPSGTVANDPGVADQTKSTDNTKINDRDRHDALTPMNQGNSAAETNITASIRKGIVGDHTLSFEAKNVKVITVGTKVTLRGPVKSDRERAVIETLAKQTAGVTDVDDQLEVKK